MPDNIAVLGAGSWGMAVARLLFAKGFKITLWEFDRNEFEKLRTLRGNPDKLQGFSLPEDIWWTEYCRPLETRIKEQCSKYGSNSEAPKIFEQCQNEIDIVKRNPEEHGSAFYIMQKM